jgi:hypothetical protein
MALGSTQPLVKMSTRNIPGGESGRCVRLTTSPSPRAEGHEIWEPKPPGTLWATPGLLRESFTFYNVFICCFNYDGIFLSQDTPTEYLKCLSGLKIFDDSILI